MDQPPNFGNRQWNLLVAQSLDTVAQAHHLPPEQAAQLLSSVLADVLLEQFEDAQQGVFFTSHDHEKLIHRPKPGHDNATPSGNGIAVCALQRLGLSGREMFAGHQ